MNNTITDQHLEKAYTYADYYLLVENLVTQEKTTGENQSPAMLEYTKLNARRMRRLNKTTVLQEELVQELSSMDQSWYWVILTEAWCGDAAQSVPVIAKMAEQTPHISFKVLLRDENPEIIGNYLTNGGKSIPKLICLDEELNEIGTWGPRPSELQDLVVDFKSNNRGSSKELGTMVQTWYTEDKTRNIQQEFLAMIRNWKVKVGS